MGGTDQVHCWARQIVWWVKSTGLPGATEQEQVWVWGFGHAKYLIISEISEISVGIWEPLCLLEAFE